MQLLIAAAEESHGCRHLQLGFLSVLHRISTLHAANRWDVSTFPKHQAFFCFFSVHKVSKVMVIAMSDAASKFCS